MKQFVFKSLLAVLILSSLHSNAQTFPCSYWPAPCPNSGAINAADDWVQRMKDNIALEQGLAFQKKLRNQLTALLQKTAQQNGWRVYELTEEAHDGPPFIFIDYASWEATPYEKRPPVSDGISFIMVVNNDSLDEWKNWRMQLQSEANNAVDSYVADSKRIDNDALLKAYFDSAQYYTQERIKYSQANEKQHLEDLKSDNKKALQEYERTEKSFSDKSDAFIKKYQDRQTSLSENVNKSVNSFQNDIAQKTAAFTEGSLVLIHFSINPYLVKTGLVDGEQHSLVPQYPLKIAGAFYAGLLVNKTIPDLHAYEVNGFMFNSPAAIAIILFGNYQSPDSYNNYRPAFERTYNSKQNVIGSVKEIKCDVLQNLSVHIEGKSDRVNSIIKSIDWNEIHSMIGK